jgi:enediyne biosynthesis thioesterase
VNEKRLFSRLKADSLIKLRLNDASIECKGSLIDFSENGFSFASNSLIDFNKKKSIELELGFEGTVIKATGEVRWVEKEKDGYRYGIFLIPDKNYKYRSKIRTLYEGKKTGYFIFEVTVYLKDVNVFGTGYFSRYFDWQGMAREEYFMTVKNFEAVMSSGVKLITKKAWVDYQNHCTVFDHLIMKIQNKNIKKFSFEMIFTYFHKHTGKPIASGGQVLVFTNHLGKLIQIPEPILDVILKHQVL